MIIRPKDANSHYADRVFRNLIYGFSVNLFARLWLDGTWLTRVYPTSLGISSPERI